MGEPDNTFRQFRAEPFKEFEVMEEFKVREISRLERVPGIPIGEYTRQMVERAADALADVIGQFADGSIESLREAVQIIRAAFCEIGLWPDVVEINVRDDRRRRVTSAKKGRPERPHPCPYRKSKRPPGVAWTVKKNQTISRSRPQARSTIRQHGDRRRP